MSTPLRNLIASVLPNFSLKELRTMVPWFEAVSNGFDSRGTLVAGCVIDGGANVQRSFGLHATSPVAHGSTGNFVIRFAETYDVNTLYCSANIYSPSSPPAGAINIYPGFQDGEHLALAIWQIAATTAARSQVDEQFIALVFQAPLDV